MSIKPKAGPPGTAVFVSDGGGTSVVVRTCDDWMALYKDGKKIHEGHSIDFVDGLRALNIDHELVDFDEQMDYTTGYLRNGDDPFPDEL